MIKKISLVFGCSGQDGSLLSRSLLKQSFEVIGTSRKIKGNENHEISNHSKLGIENDLILENCDIKNFDQVRYLIEKYKPNEIYNLAAESSVGKSYKHPKQSFTSIVDVTLNILEVCRQIKYDGNIFFAGSSEIFGNTDNQATIKHKQNPVNPYGIAKQTSYNLVKMYRERYNLKCVTGILFNHESPLRNKDFVTQKIISEALHCAQNKSHKVKMGNLNISRDWGWAEEYVEGMQLINRSFNIKDQILCTGKLTKLEDFVNITFEKLNLNWRNHVIFDPELYRVGEIKQSYGDPSQIKHDLNWEAKLDIKSIIQKLIDFKMKT